VYLAECKKRFLRREKLNIFDDKMALKRMTHEIVPNSKVDKILLAKVTRSLSGVTGDIREWRELRRKSEAMSYDDRNKFSNAQARRTAVDNVMSRIYGAVDLLEEIARVNPDNPDIQGSALRAAKRLELFAKRIGLPVRETSADRITRAIASAGEMASRSEPATHVW
jgi:hypothetical protein